MDQSQRDELLQVVTTKVLTQLQNVDESFQFGEVQAAPYWLNNSVLVVPAYWDGFLGFDLALMWFSPWEKKWEVKNVYGVHKSFDNDESAIEFMLEI